MNPDNAQIPQSPLFVCDIDDPSAGLRGWLAIHTVGSRGCCGGIRLYPDVTKEETEILARAMTYKYCICGYSLGGAKAGVQMPLDIDMYSRRTLLENFGRHIAPFLKSRIYHPWMDMNCSADDIKYVYKGAGKQLKFIPADSGYFTALSTFSALSAVAEHLDIKPDNCKVTIEGFGSVGSNLAVEIVRWGGKVIAVSNRRGTAFNPKGLDVRSLYEKRKNLGDGWIEQPGEYERLTRDELCSIETAVHIPCARTFSLSQDKAGRLKCRIIVPAANEPCAPGTEDKLSEKGILLLPFFVVNIGGITGSGLAGAGATDEQIRRIFMVDFHQMIARLLAQSRQTHTSPVEIARREADKHYTALFGSNNVIKTRKGLLSRLGIIKKPSPRQKIQELKSTFNSRFMSPLGDAGIEPATR
jgi:glutamate dehydrogenase (NAD(P)+)